MKNREVVKHYDRLNSLFDKIKQLEGLDVETEMRSHWARYLCVLTSGFLEVSVRAIYSEYLRVRVDSSVFGFLEKGLKIQNPKMNKILDLAGAFNKDWEIELRAFTEGELKDAVDSIVDVRNSISHGQDSGITYVRIKQYYESAVKVIEFIEEQCTR
ncbi:MAG: HEPN domain-containing protein [Trueperaceae bacterium]|nr:HEPN domain-containing protein [Trueperaceae bacterium]